MDEYIQNNQCCYKVCEDVQLNLTNYIVSEQTPFDISKIHKDVTQICLPRDFYKHMIGKALPNTINMVVFSRYFNKELEPGFLPHGLEEIHFEQSYNKPIKYGVVPSTVEYIEIGAFYFDVHEDIQFFGDFNVPKDQIILPPSVQEVTIYRDCLYDEPKEFVEYKKGTQAFHDRFTIYQKMVKGAY